MLVASLITDPAALTALRPAWEELLAASATNEPTQAPPWVLAWWDVFGGDDGRALRVLAFHDGPTLVGLAPLLARTVRHRKVLPFRRLELLCTGEPEADEICSDYLGVLARRDREREVAAALAKALLAGVAGPWDEVVLPSMSTATPLPSELTRQLQAGDVHTIVDEPTVCLAAQLPKTWELYLASLGSSHRYAVKRALRDFDTWAGKTWELRIADRPEQLAPARAVLESLHNERWADAGREGVFASPRFRAFHDRVLPELAARGAAEITWLEVAGDPIAATYNILWDGKVHFYQSGRKIELPKQIRPGLVIHGLAIRRSIELGRREYDFLGGDRQYKRQLANVGHPLTSVRAVRRGARELGRVAIEAGVDLARALRGLRAKAPPTTPRNEE